MRKLLCLLIFTLLPWTAWADQNAQHLADLLGRIKSYQALFVQVMGDAKGTRLQETAGFVQAKRPHLFYWETQPPLAQQIVSDGKELWVYDPDLEQVTVKKMDDKVQNTPAMLLSGDVRDLEKSYKIQYDKGKEDAEYYTLKPLGNESLFEELRLTFKSGVLSEMRLLDSLNQRTVITFSKISVNPDIPNDAFNFQMPEGVDVFREQ